MNLYQHADGGFYCLLSEDAPMKHPDSGNWLPGVIYTGIDGQLRSTTQERWRERFLECVRMPEETDGSVEAMFRRCNPDADFKMEDVWASWHESESAINSEVIELAVCATVAAVVFNDTNAVTFTVGRDSTLTVVRADITMKPIHLQHILTNYTIDREPVPDGYKISLRAKDA